MMIDFAFFFPLIPCNFATLQLLLPKLACQASSEKLQRLILQLSSATFLSAWDLCHFYFLMALRDVMPPYIYYIYI
jgi:hypothetical protein